ncbi:MAG: SDR family oxidoreductase [Ilumatobacteraceae bacterium]
MQDDVGGRVVGIGVVCVRAVQERRGARPQVVCGGGRDPRHGSPSIDRLADSPVRRPNPTGGLCVTRDCTPRVEVDEGRGERTGRGGDGCSRGIGSAIVERFAALGDTVVGLDVAAVADGETIHEVDVTDPASCRRAVLRVVDVHGGIDVLCNNAGISAVGDVVQSTPDEWERVFAVNVFGVANMSRAALPTSAPEPGPW